MKISQLIIQYKTDHHEASAQEILAYVHKKVPGAQTSLASVSSTLSRAGMATGRISNAPAQGMSDDPTKMAQDDPEETVEQATERISLRYDAMERLGKKVVGSKIPSLIISGPPGMSKSWTLTDEFKESGKHRHDGLTNVGGGAPVVEKGKVIHPGWYDHIGGSCTAVGLYHALWNMRDGGVVLLDDCDSVFRDEDALNLLKIATDSTKERLCSWRKNASWLDEWDIDKTFDFKGSIAFLTNIDFEDVISKGHRDSEHFKALIDRSAYLCLTLRTPRDFMIRIRQVCDGDERAPKGKGMLAKFFGMKDQARRAELLDFVEENKARWYNLSIRLVTKLAILMREDPKDWKKDAEATNMRTRR